MKTSKQVCCRLLRCTAAVLAVLSLCVGRVHCQIPVEGIPHQELITVQATIKNNLGKPVGGAALSVENQGGRPVDNPDLVYYMSSETGQISIQYFKAPAYYFVTASADGYFDSAPQKISALHDANLKFVLKKNPKYVSVRPVAIPNYAVMPNLGAPRVVQNINGPVQKAVVVFVSPFNGFHRNIHLSVAHLPHGLSATFNPAVVPIKPPDVHSQASRDVRSQLVFRVASTVRPGQYKVDLRSTPTGSHSTRHWPFSLTVLPAAHDTQFKVAQSEAGLEIIPGGQARTVTLTLHSGAEFHGPVKLRLQNDPSAPLLDTPTFSRSTLDADHPVSTLTFRLGLHTAEGFHNLLVTATAPTGTQTLLLPVTVLSHTYSATPTPITERPGQAAPPLAESLEEMTRHDMSETKNKPPSHRP